MALFRVYEDGKPVKSDNYFKWSKDGAKDRELVFVSGHPGSTARLNTVAHLEYLRDAGFPFTIKLLEREHDLLGKYRSQGEEQARRAQEDFLRIENALKAYRGEYAGLLDKSLLAQKQQAEDALRRGVAADPTKLKEYGDAWDNIARGRQSLRNYYRELSLMRTGQGSIQSCSASLARLCVWMLKARSRTPSACLNTPTHAASRSS